MNTAAVGNFMGHINFLSKEARTGEVQRLAAMRREYLEGLDEESAAAAKQGADLIVESYGAEERLESQDYYRQIACTGRTLRAAGSAENCSEKERQVFSSLIFHFSVLQSTDYLQSNRRGGGV